MTSDSDDDDSTPIRSFDQIMDELLRFKGGAQDDEGAIFVDGDGIHGSLPENVRRTLLSALERKRNGKGRSAMIRRESLRASRDVVTMLKAQIISRCELLERTADWSEAEAIAFVEVAVAASCARLREEAVHHAALDGYAADDRDLRDLSADGYLDLCEAAEAEGDKRVASTLSSGRRSHERLERYRGVLQVLSEPE